MSDGFTRREVIGASAVALTLPATVHAAPAPENSPHPGRVRERLRDWRFHLGHAAEVERDFGFGRDQRTFAKAGVAADAAMPKFDGRAEVQVPHDWAVALPFARPAGPPPKDRASATVIPTASKQMSPLSAAHSTDWRRRSSASIRSGPSASR